MKMVIVEDDYLQVDWLRSALRQRWPEAEIVIAATESEFRRDFDRLFRDSPDLVFIDAMLRWEDPRPDMITPPADVADGGTAEAGFRCINMLQQHSSTRDIPIILFTVLDRLDLAKDLLGLPANVRFLQKPPDAQRVVQFAGSIMATRRPVASSATGPRDVFICHASEDRIAVVDPLVSALQAANITVWHDRAEIQWGDSLASKIQEGLARCRYVLAVLSRHSLAKRWPLGELHAAMSGEISSGAVKVLPLLVGSEEERAAILRQLPFQQDKLFEVWTGSPDPIVTRLKDRLRTWR